MQTTPSSKPFAAWATALTDKYRFNPFVRTTVHIILLQTLLAIVMIGVFVWGVRFAQESTVASITRSIMDAMSSGTTSIETLPESIEEVRQDTYTFMLIGVILLNALFGYLLTRFALRPTRNSLGSQKQFIGNVAHEIRTPLAIMKTNTEVALFDPNLAPAVKQTFEDTLVELDRVSEIINNLLTFDTLTRPRRMQFEPVDLAAVAETIRARHEALARERGIALRTDISGESMIDGNATALEQVVTNLVKNALNYTPQHQDGSVTIIVNRTMDGRVALSVSDTGIGINQKDLFHVFEPFYRGDTSRARGIGTGSSGLGLAIVNEIVRMHRGAVSIRSALGRGTEIRIAFPKAKAMNETGSLESEGTGTSEVAVDFS